MSAEAGQGRAGWAVACCEQTGLRRPWLVQIIGNVIVRLMSTVGWKRSGESQAWAAGADVRPVWWPLRRALLLGGVLPLALTVLRGAA